MTDSDDQTVGAPAKRGEDTPVPKDIETKKFRRPDEQGPQDDLIPMSYVEQRAEERQSEPRPSLYYLSADDDEPQGDVANPLAGKAGAVAGAGPGVANPMLALQAQAMAYAPPMQQPMMPGYIPAGYVPQGGQLAAYPTAQPAYGYPQQMHQLQGAHAYAQPMGVPGQYPAPYGVQYPGQYPMYGQQPMGAQNPMAYAQPYGAGFNVPGVFGPPREVWSKRRKRAAIWSSFVQQSLASFALHLFVFGGLFLWIASMSWNDFAETAMLDGPETFTGFMVWLSHPSRVWISVLLLLLVTGALFALGYWIGALWQKSAGIRQGRARAFWLAGVSGGGITVFAWVIVYFILWFVLFIWVSIDGQGIGGIWMASLGLMMFASIIHGFYSMAFSRMFLHGSRPQVDLQQLAAEAEARARAADHQRMAGDDPDAEYRISGTVGN